MRCDMWQGIVPMVLVVFLYHTGKQIAVIQSYFRLAFAVDKQKITVPVYLDGLAFGSSLENPWNARIVSLLSGTCLVPLLVFGVSI